MIPACLWLLSLSVFDRVCPSPACKDLFASSNCDLSGVQSHRLYDRGSGPKSDLEATMEEILNALEDEAPFVEYWSRAAWQNLDAHRDVDEAHAKTLPPVPEWGEAMCSKDDFRFPVNGHVLYLDVEGEEVGLGKGGTCVFGEGWSDVTVVTPREGRLLRFPGDAMHSVPRGPLSYFDEEHGGTNHLIYTRKRNDKERRGVVLFNTWQERPTGDWDGNDNGNVSEEKGRRSFASAFGEWERVDVIDGADDGAELRMKVALLGDRRRREGVIGRYRELVAKGSEVINLFNGGDGSDFIPRTFRVSIAE
mmetsp:Transcript_8685/g.17428  ORF Transcript_8685/g.17428 Transcript_8685/m.17428 type:complete len:307 (-) Transcript_8685:6-926(-)